MTTDESGNSVDPPHAMAKSPEGPGRGWALWYAATLWGALAVMTLGGKLFKLIKLGSGLSPVNMLAVMGMDLLFLVLGYAVWVWALSRPRRGAFRVALVAYHVLVPLLFVLCFCDHAFFDISGAVADWYILEDGLIRFASLADLYRSQLTVSRAIGLSAPLLLSLGVLGVERILRRWRPGIFQYDLLPRWLIRTGGGLLVLGFVGVLLPPPHAAGSIQRNVITGLVWDIVEDKLVSRFTNQPVMADIEHGQLGPSSVHRVAKTPVKNVVVVAMESTGARYTSLFSELGTTPHLGELAHRGALVEHAYTVVPHTSKALVAMHCGIYPKLFPSVDEANAGGIPARCMPRLLRDQGFDTAFFQPAEESYERRASLVKELGFEHFEGKESLDGTGFDECNYFGWEDNAMLPRIERWLDTHGDKPFWLSVLTLTSHHPYAIPKGCPTQKFTRDKELNDYLNTVAYTDRFVGGLVDALDRRGLLESTALVVLGDHGEGFGQHGLRQHDPIPYEEGVHIPLIIVAPGVQPGSRVGGLRQLVDIAPTLAGLLGFEPDRPFFGQRLFESEGHERLFLSCHYHRYCMAMIDGTTKFVYHYQRRDPQIFDLSSDPEERHDLYPQRTGDMDSALEKAIDEMHLRVATTNAAYERAGRAQAGRHVRSEPFEGDTGARLDATIGDFVRVHGVKVEPPAFEAGGRSVITSYFEVLQDPPSDMRLFMHIEGPTRLNADHVPVEGAYPVPEWRAGDFIEDRYTFGTRPDTEPGRYRILMGFYDPNGRAKASAGDGAEVTRDGRLDVGTLEVTYPHVDPSRYVSEAPTAQATADVRVGAFMRILASEIDKPESKGGLKVTATMHIEVLQTPPPGVELYVEMRGPRRRQMRHDPVYSSWPLGQWRPGQFIRDPHAVVTHTRDPLGTYTMWLWARDERDRSRVPITGTGLPIENDAVQIATVRLTR